MFKTMDNSILRKFCFWAALFLIAFAGQASARPLEVVVTTSMIESAVRDACGDDTELTIKRLIPPGNCPGHFDLKPRMLETVKAADFFIYHDFQRGIEAKVKAVDPDAEMLVVGVDGSYLVPSNYRKLVRSIKESLKPETAGKRLENAEESHGDVADLEDKWKDAAKEHGWVGAPVLAAAMQADFCRWLGFDVVGIVPRSDSSSPRMISKLLNTRAAMVIDNRQTGGSAARMLGRRLKIPVATLSNFPESKGPGAYEKLADKNLGILEKAWQKR